MAAASRGRAVVIGAGFAGLGTAALLARDGWDVCVLEKNATVGGRAMVLEEGGFRWDMGPSWYLMPEVIEAFLARVGAVPPPLRRLDPSYRLYFRGEGHVDVAADVEQNVAWFEEAEKGAGARLREYLRRGKVMYDAAVGELLRRDYVALWDFLSWRTLTEGSKMQAFGSLEWYAKRFFRDHRLQKALTYSTVFLGGAPMNTPALYSLLAHVDMELGVWYPMGGMWALVETMRAAAEAAGARVECGREVTRIEVGSDGRARGVRVGDEVVEADVVVMTGDYPHGEMDLLGEGERSYGEEYWRSRTWAPSALMIYLGVEGKVDGLLHHTLVLEREWNEHFKSIFTTPAWPEKPCYYVCCPSKTDPSVAPAGMENVVVLAPVAVGLDDSDATREAYAERVLVGIEAETGVRLRSAVRVQRLFSGMDYLATYNAYRGTALTLSHTLRQTAIWRPARRSRRVGGLYYAGQYTHPGIGVPMALLSAELAASAVKSDAGVEKGLHGP